MTLPKWVSVVFFLGAIKPEAPSEDNSSDGYASVRYEDRKHSTLGQQRAALIMNIITTHSLFDGRAVFFYCHTIISSCDLFEVVQQQEIGADINFHCLRSVLLQMSAAQGHWSFPWQLHGGRPALTKVGDAKYEAKKVV